MLSKLGRKRISIQVSKRKPVAEVITTDAVYHEVTPGKYRKENDIHNLYTWNNSTQQMVKALEVTTEKA